MNSIHSWRISSILLILFTHTAQSQTDSSSQTLNEVVVAANRIEQQRFELPQQITVLTSKEMEVLDNSTNADLLQQSGSLAVQKSQLGGGSPVIRGFEASRILLVIDDVRMNNLIYRAGHLQNIITVDPTILDRLEILYGPSSTVYGSDALGGVIHLRTRQPAFSASNKAVVNGGGTIRYASASQEQTIHAFVNASATAIASLTSISVSSFGDLRMGKQSGSLDSAWGKRYYYVDRINGVDSLVANADPYLQKFSGYNQIDILEKLSYRGGSNTVHGLNLQFSTSTDVPRYDRLTDPSASTGLKYAEWYYGPQERFMAAYTLDHQMNGGFFSRLKGVASYQHVVESRHSRSFGKAERTDRVESVAVAGYTVFVEHDKNNQLLQIGIDGQYSTVGSTAGIYNVSTGASAEQSTRYPDGGNSMNFVAAYISHESKMSSKFAIHDGLRLTYTSLHSLFEDTTFFPFPFSDVTQNYLSLCGNLGVVWHPTADSKIALLASSGFRAPNVDDLSKVFESAPGAVIVPNPDLKPERTWGLELNTAMLIAHHITWENNLYYTIFNNAIVTQPGKFNGKDSVAYDGLYSSVLTNQNERSAYLYGFNSTVTADIAAYWKASATITYTYGRINTDTTAVPLDHIPPVYGRIGLGYAKKKILAEAFVLFNGEKAIKNYFLGGEDNEQYATSLGMPSWYTLNLRCSYSVCDYFILRLGVDNVMDQNYRTFSSGIQAPGRNLIVAAHVKF